MLQKCFWGQTFYQWISQHVLCGNVVNTNMRLNYFLSNKEIFNVDMLGAWRVPRISKEGNCCIIITKYLQWCHNGIHNTQPWDTLLQPHSLACSLITSNILCLHIWGSCKCLFDTFLTSIPSCHHEHITQSWSPIIWITCIIGIDQSVQHLEC